MTMVQIIMFDKTDDILQLTGLKTRAELWDTGFNLDDWDAGFCSDIRLHEETTYISEDDGREYTDIEWIPEAHWLGWQMENYCVGFNYCEYNGKHYYTVHHS